MNSDDKKQKYEHYKFFENTECENFPCHKSPESGDFNCLFYYCPLYVLGKKCGGNFRYTEKGIKSCKDCSFPHHRENYGKIISRFKEIAEIMEETESKN